MSLTINQTNQLLLNHSLARNSVDTVLTSKLYTKLKKTYKYEDRTGEYWQRLLRFFASKTQKRALMWKRKAHSVYSSRRLVNHNLFRCVNNVSTTVQTFYGFFFLNFYHTAVNSAFRNKKITISNTYSKVLENTRKFTHPLNRIYVKMYKSLVCKQPFNTAKPVMSYLIRSSSLQSSLHTTHFAQRRHLLIGLYAMLYGSTALGKNSENTKTLTHRYGHYPVTRGSKVIYSLNQYLLNFFI